MITIKANWEQRTKLGHTLCESSKTIYRNYRDIDNVDEAVNWVSKLFTDKGISNPSVDFLYDDDTAYGCIISRYFKEYTEGFARVYFGGMGNGIKTTVMKLTKKELKEAYLECADKCMEYEERVNEEC